RGEQVLELADSRGPDKDSSLEGLDSLEVRCLPGLLKFIGEILDLSQLMDDLVMVSDCCHARSRVAAERGQLSRHVLFGRTNRLGRSLSGLFKRLPDLRRNPVLIQLENLVDL